MKTGSALLATSLTMKASSTFLTMEAVFSTYGERRLTEVIRSWSKKNLEGLVTLDGERVSWQRLGRGGEECLLSDVCDGSSNVCSVFKNCPIQMTNHVHYKSIRVRKFSKECATELREV